MAYGTDQGLIDYLAESGRVLPSGAVAAQVRFMGSLYVNSFEDLYASTASQDGASFPRTRWPVVPVAVEYAAYEAAYAYANGTDIFGNGGSQGGQVIRERVDSLEIQYAAPQDGAGYWDTNRFILPLAYQYLLPYFSKGGWGAAFIV